MSEYPTYLVNGVNLHNPSAGWVLERSTRSPGEWSQEVTQVSSPNLDGVVLAGNPRRLSPGKLGISIAVWADSYPQLLERVARIHAAVRGDVQIELRPSAGATPRTARGRVRSFTTQEHAQKATTITVSILLPYPVWEEKTTVTGSLSTGTHWVPGLEGGSAPVEVAWTLPTGLTEFSAQCAHSGELVNVAAGNALGAAMTVAGWRSKLGSRVDSWGRLHPDHLGRYRVKITTSHPATYTARKSFL